MTENGEHTESARREPSRPDGRIKRRRVLKSGLVTSTVLATGGVTGLATGGTAGHTAAHPTDDWDDLSLKEQLKVVRKATQPYRDLDTMAGAGYVSSPIPLFCSEGYHFDNLANWGTAQLDPENPESLFYVLNPGGKLVLGGAEYIVVTELDENADLVDPEPDLFNDESEPVEDDPLRGTTESDGWHVIEDPASGLVLWDLHVWIHEDNPAGVFSLPNPRYADLPGCVELEV